MEFIERGLIESPLLPPAISVSQISLTGHSTEDFPLLIGVDHKVATEGNFTSWLNAKWAIDPSVVGLLLPGFDAAKTEAMVTILQDGEKTISGKVF